MRLFKRKECQNEKLIENIRKLDEKEKTKQQESKIYGQKPVKRTTNKEKSTSVHNSPRV